MKAPSSPHPRVLIFSLWLSVMLIPAASALTVTTTADELDTPAGANVSLREAIRDTPSGGTVDFDTGLNGFIIKLTLGELSISSKNLTLDASGLSKGITVSGNHSSRILTISNSTMTLENLILTNGQVTGGGGAISLTTTSDLTLTNCQLIENHSSLQGGGILCFDSTLTINTSRIFFNSSSTSHGGAMAIIGSSSLVLDGCSLHENTAKSSGGGIYTSGATSIAIKNSSVSKNIALTAGGIAMNNTPLTMENSTCAQNQAFSSSGAIFSNNDLTLTSCTISENIASVAGGGMSVNSSGTRHFTNCIIANNQAATNADINLASGTITTSGVNLIGTNSGCETAFPEGNLNTNGDMAGTDAHKIDPKLSPLARFGGDSESMHPLTGSPTIDTGSSSLLLNDQRGFSRVVGSAVDIGSVEVGPTLTVTTSTDENNGVLGSGSGDSLRECLEVATGNGDLIRFHSSLSGQTILLTNGEMDLFLKSVFVDASDLAARITINANTTSRIFSIIESSTLALHSINLSNGYLGGANNSYGGAIECHSSDLSIMNSLISDNTATGVDFCGGGAIYTIQGNLTLHECSFVNNAVHSGSLINTGAGIELGAGSRATISNSTFNNNLAYGGTSSSNEGAAIYNRIGSLSIKNCEFLNNQSSTHAFSSGGAIHSNGLTTINQCAFSNNKIFLISGTGSTRGGAVSNASDKTMHITNSTFTNNSADTEGGAIYSLGLLILKHNTIHSNTAVNSGGGGLSIGLGEAHFENNIIAENSTGSTNADVSKGASATITAAGANLIGDNSSVNGTFPVGDLVGDLGSPVLPLLGPLGNHGGYSSTMPPLPNSPAVNAAIFTDGSPLVDQRALIRTFGSSDLGAYETGHIVGYSTWVVEKITSGFDDGFAEDSELDSNKNGIEYATGRNPAVSEAGDILSLVRMPKSGGGYEMHITFAYEPNAPDLKYKVKRSTDLGSFGARYNHTPSTGEENVPPNGTVTFTRDVINKTITVIDAGLSGTPYFWRLEVELLP